jgi:hypothetical protein
LTTTEVGITPVNVLLARSFFTERETKAFGVTGHVQQEINCSSGENVYTFAQILPTAVPNPGPSRGAPLRPELLMSITESPFWRLAAYRTRNAFSGTGVEKVTLAAAVLVQFPVGGGGVFTIVMVQLAVAVPAAVPVESTTLAVKLNGPAVVGVPVMAPVLAFNPRTGGKLPEVIENVSGGTPPLATKAEL